MIGFQDLLLLILGVITEKFQPSPFLTEKRVIDFYSFYLAFSDHKWGIFSLIPNVIWRYGWNQGNRFLEWFGELLRETTGDPDITFEQVC